MTHSADPVAVSQNSPAVFPEHDPPGDGWLSTPEAAALLGITPKRFQDLSDKRALPRRKVALKAYYPRVVIEAEKHWRENPPPRPVRATAEDAPAPSRATGGGPESEAADQAIWHQLMRSRDKAIDIQGQRMRLRRR